MAKKRKGSAKSRVARGKKKATKKKPAKPKSAARKVAAKKASAAKKAGSHSKSGSAPAKHLAKPSDEENTKPKIIAKQAVPLEPKDEDLDEEVGDEELEMSGEGEIEEDEMEEELSLDDEDEDVDYLEKSEDLLDDSDDYRTH